MKVLASYGLIFSLLLAGLQVPVFSHTCYLFGVTETSLYSSVYCCEKSTSPEEHQEDRIAIKCCSVDIKTYKAELETDLTSAFKINIYTPITTFYQSVRKGFISTEESLNIHQRPPPDLPFNRTLHHFIQVFRL